MKLTEDKSDDLNKNNLVYTIIFSVVTISSLVLGYVLRSELDRLELDMLSSRLVLNNTGRAENQDLLVFNRVPKVGSQTMHNLITRLGKRNNFTSYKDDDDNVRLRGETTMLYSDIEQAMFMQLFPKLSLPAAYTKHISFLDFERFQSLSKWSDLVDENEYQYKKPIFINIVREPIHRIISWYYYVRAPWYIITSGLNGSLELRSNAISFYKQSYEECVQSGNQECTYIPGHNFIDHDEGGSHVSQIMFFCGHKPHCTVLNGEKAYREAVTNVEKYYAVVGVLEDFDKSMQVFEKYIPKFFAGAVEEYRLLNKYAGSVNKNIYQPPVDEVIKNLVRKNMSKEVDFYNYCRQRLHKQYLTINH